MAKQFHFSLFLPLLLLLFVHPVFADQTRLSREPRLAQFEGDESYDPFADYSEFEDAAEEEADINFFRNGRFLTLGFSGGVRQFTSVYGEIDAPGVLFGLFITYFFDLRFAMQFGYSNSDHSRQIKTNSNTLLGSVNLSALSFDLKYFLNTQNVTRGLASLNPYLIGGITSFNRTVAYPNEPDPYRDPTIGFDFGAGIEIPMLRNKMFFGAQFCYHYANFPEENQQAVIQNQPQNFIYQGDVFSINALLGVNF